MRPDAPALCVGEVFHRRLRPTAHEFRYPLSYVWFDPDAPDAVASQHRLWSASRPAPARFRRRDYGDGGDRRLGDQVRDDLAAALGTRPTGPVRMLTQWRRWGWLFNPITIYLAWNDDPDLPVGAVLEVTNTPWKERHRYATALRHESDGDRDAFTAEFDKVMHVSPFLDEGYRYRMTVHERDRDIAFGIDVIDRAGGELVLTTGMRLERRPVSGAVLGAALRTERFPTHRVSAGIHAQAARLWRHRVPFVRHPHERAGTRAR